MWSSYLLNYKWNLEHYILKDEEPVQALHFLSNQNYHSFLQLINSEIYPIKPKGANINAYSNI